MADNQIKKLYMELISETKMTPADEIKKLAMRKAKEADKEKDAENKAELDGVVVGLGMAYQILTGKQM